MNKLYSEKYFKDDSCNWLVLLHGFGGSTKLWKNQIEILSKKFNLLVIDLPGHGKSIDGIGNKSISTFAEIGDIVVETMKKEHIFNAVFVCVSLGTLVLGGILKNHSEVVKGAILCGAVVGINKIIQILLKLVLKIQKFFPYMLLMHIGSFILLPRYNHQKSRNFFIQSSKLLGTSEFRAWLRLSINDLNILNILQYCNVNNILFVMGSQDYIFKPGVRKKLKDFKNAKLQIIEKCGHVCNLQKAEEFNCIVLNNF